MSLDQWPEAQWSIDVVAELVNRSLCAISPTPRLNGRIYLLTSIAEYAADRLKEFGSEFMEGARRRHAQHYALLGTSQHIDSLNLSDGVGRRELLKVEMGPILQAVMPLGVLHLKNPINERLCP